MDFKKLFLTLCFPFNSFLIAQNSIDSTQFSAETNLSLFTVMVYNKPNYEKINSSKELSGNSILKFSLYTKRINFKIEEHIHVGIGVNYSSEVISSSSYKLYDIDNKNYISRNIGTTRLKYLGIPIYLTLKLPTSELKRVFTNFELGFINDFILYEKVEGGGDESLYTTFEYFNSSGSHRVGNKKMATIKNIEENQRIYRASFNRISPYVSIMFEWLSKNKIISFKCGSMYTFESIYQVDNTVEFVKSKKITPLILGLCYRF